MKKKLIASIIASTLSPNVFAQTLPTVNVKTNPPTSLFEQRIVKSTITNHSSRFSDIVNILKTNPSISVNQAGTVSNLPVIRGMADHRLNVEMDGMPLLASCPNHMNSPLSYLSPSQVDSVTIFPSITPVSLGGDSLGGTISVNSGTTFFAPDSQFITQGEMGTFFRDNGNAMGADVAITTANNRLSLTYKGAKSQSKNYHAANHFKSSTTTAVGHTRTQFSPHVKPGDSTKLDEVAGTAYESTNHAFELAIKHDKSLIQAHVNVQDMPYQQYPNQRMDLTGNQSTKFNIALEQAMNWGGLNLQAYGEKVAHDMGFFDYKTSLQMPMETQSRTHGFKASAMLVIDDDSEFLFGADLQHYTLDDWWRKSCPSMAMCGDYSAFLNINNGTRNRNALFAEWIGAIATQWNTRVGLRYEQVNTDTDRVHGYNASNLMIMSGNTNELNDSTHFNNQDRSVTDHNVSITALATYKHHANLDIDIGFARQVRSPSLYERYTWSTWAMAGIMNNFVGDGNGYYGDINLQPETAYTVNTKLDWHARDKQRWFLQVMPYITHIENYIDAQKKTNTQPFNVYQYLNQTARMTGLDIAAQVNLIDNHWGQFQATAKLNYTRGINTETNDNLINIMPLNATLGLTQSFNHWHNSLEWLLVKDKTAVSKTRNELRTPGYSLVNVKTHYQFKNLRLDFGIDNLFDRAYSLPTGGIYSGEGNTMMINGISSLAVPGAGRTIYAGINYKF